MKGRVGRLVLGVERELPGRHLEESDAEAVEVRSLRARPQAVELLGAHVGTAARGEARELRHAPVGERGEAEVEELGRPVAHDEDVVRLEVAVQDPPRVRVERVERPRDPLRDREHLVERQRPAAHLLDQGLALEELHGHVERGAALERRLVHVETADDVGMLDRPERRRLAQEELAELALALLVRGREDHLERDPAPVDGVERAVDAAHAARAQDLVHLVEADARRGRRALGGGVLARRQRLALGDHLSSTLGRGASRATRGA